MIAHNLTKVDRHRLAVEIVERTVSFTLGAIGYRRCWSKKEFLDNVSPVAG